SAQNRSVSTHARAVLENDDENDQKKKGGQDPRQGQAARPGRPGALHGRRDEDPHRHGVHRRRHPQAAAARRTTPRPELFPGSSSSSSSLSLSSLSREKKTTNASHGNQKTSRSWASSSRWPRRSRRSTTTG